MTNVTSIGINATCNDRLRYTNTIVEKADKLLPELERMDNKTKFAEIAGFKFLITTDMLNDKGLRYADSVIDELMKIYSVK